MEENNMGKNYNRRRNSANTNQNGDKNGSSTGQPNQSQLADTNANFWSKFQAQYADATRLPVNRIGNVPIDSNTLYGPYIADRYAEAFPGAMRINFIPSIGNAGGMESPVNRAFLRIHAEIYANTSVALQFQPADVALLTLALDSIAINIGLVSRALCISGKYDPDDYLYPHRLIECLGFDPQSIIGKQDLIRQELNDCIRSLNTLRLPAFTDLFVWHWKLATRIYRDNVELSKSQLYFFQPVVYYLYVDNDGGKMVPEYLKSCDMPWSQSNNIDIMEIITVIRQQLGAIRNSSAASLVAGGVKRAFEDKFALALDHISPEDSIDTTFDVTMLEMINNMTIIGDLNFHAPDITCDPVKNTIEFSFDTQAFDDRNELLHHLGGAAMPHHLLNSTMGNWSADWFMNVTRFMAGGEIRINSNGKYFFHFTTMGTEYIQSVDILSVVRNDEGDDNSLNPNMVVFNRIYGYLESMDGNALKVSTKLSKFGFAPRVPVISTSNNMIFGWTGDISNYTFVDNDALRGLNQAALNSLYYFEP